MSEQQEEVQRRKRRTLEEREADLKAELEEIQKMRLSRYKEKVTEAVSMLESIAATPGLPPDLTQTIRNVLPSLKKHAG